MISDLKVIRSCDTLPYSNIALEHFLTCSVREGECILFLWQNRRTVVIGRNQNAWAECRIGQLEKDRGYLARRLSGGGAVYHDLGNLNFTFISSKKDHDVTKQTEVILRALRKLGIRAERTGRNDITAEGRKFSGSAYYETAGNRCHHGTLMMDVDTEQMSRYLNVSPDKLRSKGVASVRSRVANLKDLCPQIDRDLLSRKLEESFAEVYALPLRLFEEERLDADAIGMKTEYLRSDEWLYGRRIPFTSSFYERFSWGGVRIELNVSGGVITDAVCWSDAMDAAYIEDLAPVLTGTSYRSADITQRIQESGSEDPARKQMADDICRMFSSQME